MKPMNEKCIYCEMPPHSGSNCDREQLKQVIRNLRVMADVAKPIGGPPGMVMITSLVSQRTHKPRVDIQIGNAHCQVSSDAAMDIAKNLIEVSQGAFADAFIFNFMTEKIGVDKERAMMVIPEFRDYRMTLAEEFKKEQEEP